MDTEVVSMASCVHTVWTTYNRLLSWACGTAKSTSLPWIPLATLVHRAAGICGVARVCREAGGRVTLNMMVRDMDLESGVNAGEETRGGN